MTEQTLLWDCGPQTHPQAQVSRIGQTRGPETVLFVNQDSWVEQALCDKPSVTRMSVESMALTLYLMEKWRSTFKQVETVHEEDRD